MLKKYIVDDLLVTKRKWCMYSFYENTKNEIRSTPTSSSPGATQSSQTHGGRRGRGKGGRGSQITFKEKLIATLHARNSFRTSAYICMGNVEGSLKFGLGKTPALSGRILTDQWEEMKFGYLRKEASLAKQHPRHNCCNSQGGLQQDQQHPSQNPSPQQPEEVTRKHGY
jgi:hypothetical protein